MWRLEHGPYGAAVLAHYDRYIFYTTSDRTAGGAVCFGEASRFRGCVSVSVRKPI